MQQNKNCFHIIINSSLTKNGDLLGRDYLGNIIEIPNQVITRLDFKINVRNRFEYPFFATSVKTSNDGIEKLTANFVCKKIYNYVKVLEDKIGANIITKNICLEVNNLKYVINEFENYINSMNDENFVLLNDGDQNLFSNSIKIVFSHKKCFPLIKLFKKKDETKIFLLNDENPDYFNDFYHSEIGEANHILISRLPLYYFNPNKRDYLELYYKIITYDKFLKFDKYLSPQNYINQFYEKHNADIFFNYYADKNIKSVISNYIKSNSWIENSMNLLNNYEYKIDSTLNKQISLQKEFNKLTYYAITPILKNINDDSSIIELHNSILSICEELVNNGIENFCIFPPEDWNRYKHLDLDHYLFPPEEPELPQDWY